MLRASPIENYISPSNLLGLVENTAPFLMQQIRERYVRPGARLIELGQDSQGYLQILNAGQNIENAELSPEALTEDYFAFCMACHHATVGTFVPTDVDSKIRGLLWRQNRDRESLRRMFDFTMTSMRWSIEGLSRRYTEVSGVGPVSGHNGEQLSVLAGGLGQFLKRGDEEYAQKAAHAIEVELKREAVALRFTMSAKGHELDVLRCVAALTHNVGDLDQGISFWPTMATHDAARARFARLAHENVTPYEGAFHIAARIYRKAMATEGHRNYPLRPVKPLRRSAEFLIPFSPFLDEWGAMLGIHPALDWDARAEVLAALIHGCRTIANQRGYFRALHGMSESLGGDFERVLRLTPASTRASWKDANLRKQIAVPKVSFESMMKKMAVL